MRSRVGRAAMGRGADSPAPRPRGPPPADGTCRYPPWSGSYCWAPSWPPLGVSACPPGETLLLSGTFSVLGSSRKKSKEVPRLSPPPAPNFSSESFRRLRGEARAGVAEDFTLAEESYPNHIAMPYRLYASTRPTLRRSRARDDPSTTTDTPPPRPKTPPPLKPPAMAEADDDKKWYSKPNKRESLWGLGGMAVRPATRPCRLFPEPARVREYRPSARGRFVPREFPRAFLASQRVVPLRAIRRSPPPSPASSTSSRGRRTRRWTRSDRARRERTARAPRREATHTASRDEGLKLRARRRAVSARGPSAAIRDGR